MAKKKAKRAAPTRACESCSTAYHPRSAKCPKCGAANPTLHSVSRKKKSGRRGAASADAVVAAIDFVEQAGSLKAAQAAMDTIERIKGM